MNEQLMQWLEETVKTILEKELKTIGIVAIRENGDVLTSYYGVDQTDMAIMAHNIQMDIVWENLGINRDRLAELLDEDDGEETE